MDALSKTFTVDQTPQQVFDAINDVRSWWSGTIVGSTDSVGDEWVYVVPDIHFSKQRVTELVPGRRVAWLVLDSELSFLKDKKEWIGTIEFDIAEVDGRTQVRFTHTGLTSQVECFEVCDLAWREYILGSLRERVSTGTGAPNSFEGDAAVEAARARAVIG